MPYLKTLVENDATTIIAHLKISNDNCEVTLNLLKERYGDKQFLISSHMKILLKWNTVANIKDITSLRTIYEIIETKMRSLKNV